MGKVKTMTIEELDKVLESPLLEPVKKSSLGDEDYFQRERTFMALGQTYRIKWWINISYLFIGDVEIPFNYCRVQGTWPNQFKNNIQFYDYTGEVCCIVPIDKWEAPTTPESESGDNDYIDSTLVGGE